MNSLTLFQISDDVLESVVKKLNYSSLNSFNEDVLKVQEWMEKQQHFPEIMGEKKIQNFLILNKGRVEQTKEKIDNYYTLRSRHPEIFEDINDIFTSIHNFSDQCYFVPLPKLTKEMYRVIFYKPRDKVLINNFNPMDEIRYLLFLQELRLIEDVTYGDIFIMDAEDVPFSVCAKLTPSVLYKGMITIYKNIFSNRLKAAYVLNAPPFIEKLLSVLKAILKPKLIERIHFVQNYEALHEKIEKEILPEDCGGGEKSLEELRGMTRQKFQENRRYIEELCQLRTNEKLRTGDLKNNEMFGFNGNFKKLEVD